MYIIKRSIQNVLPPSGGAIWLLLLWLPPVLDRWNTCATESAAATQITGCTHARGKSWRGSWICFFCSPRLPTAWPRPQRTPAWHRWPPWSRTYSSSARPNCCRRRWQQSYACIRSSCASRTPESACRSVGRRIIRLSCCEWGRSWKHLHFSHRLILHAKIYCFF